MVNIFKYTDYRKYLRDLYEEKKQTTKHFSFRYFAKAAGFASPNYFKLIMDGDRNLSQNGIRKFSKGLKLKKNEREFFENLVFFNQSKTDEEKNFYYKRLKSSKKYLNARAIEKDQYEYYSKWYNVAIRELVALSDFQNDSSWISNKLGGVVSPKEAAEAVKLLLRLKLLKKKKDGSLEASDSSITTGPEVGSLAVANFHREMLKKASDSLDKTHHLHRDVSCLTIPVSEETLKEVKKKVQEFRKDLHAYIADQKKYDAVYQFNFQLFNLSRVDWEEK